MAEGLDILALAQEASRVPEASMSVVQIEEFREIEQRILDRAAWLDLPDHMIRFFGFKPPLTTGEAVRRVETDTDRRLNNLQRSSRLRNFGRGMVSLLE